jgi:hypothetical protein
MMKRRIMEETIDIKKYLVTEKSDISKFSKDKILSDFKAIEKAEIQSRNRSVITTDEKRNNDVTRAMRALKLSNPFKGN